MLDKIPPIFKNFYFLASAAFIVWMSFFDSNDFFTLYGLNKKISDLESDKNYYIEKIDEVKKDREELLSDSELLERFARERYLMKKESEDLYVIIPEN
ncbi:septum formation initiator family protein [Hyphobacterium sp. CCMP332]|nr:septum formation initiator family protein [Hyphobacterium sp. CCMP332]